MSAGARFVRVGATPLLAAVACAFSAAACAPSAAAAQASWSLDSRPIFVLGASPTDARDQFGRIIDVAIASDGSLAVLDGNPVGLRTFRPDGSLRAAFGGEGDGPGELRRPLGVALKSEGIVVFDQRGRRSRFDLDGRLLGTDRFVADAACDERSNARPAAPLSDGSVLVRCEERLFGRVRGEYRQQVGLVRLEEPGVRPTPFGWFPADSGRTDKGSVAIPRPYAPRSRLLHVSANGRLFVASSHRPRIDAFGFDGELRRRLPVPLRSRATTDADMADHLETSSRVGGSENDQRVVREWAEEMPRAAETPVIRHLVTGGPDELWVQGFSDGAAWLLLDVETAAVRTRIELSPRDQIVAASGDRIVVLSRDAFGVERLSVYGLRRGR